MKLLSVLVSALVVQVAFAERYERTFEVLPAQSVKLVCAEAGEWKFDVTLAHPEAGLAELTVALKHPSEAVPPKNW